MAVRVTHTNNSSGHDGTYVYRSTSPMDPQNLPTPIADEAPVALGATFEYIDGTVGQEDYYYRTQDHEGGQVSTVSTEVFISLEPDYSTAQVGDEIGGGIYAGTHSDGVDSWHVIFAKQSGESYGLQWGGYGTLTTAINDDDGLHNQNEVLNNHESGDREAFYHCRDYVDSVGNGDYYMPSRNELAKIDPLIDMNHPEFTTDLSAYRWSSTDRTSSQVYVRRPSDGLEGTWGDKDTLTYRTRPIRRVYI